MNLLGKIGNFVTGAQNQQTGNNSFSFGSGKIRNNNEKPIKFWDVKFNSFEITEAATRMSEAIKMGEQPNLTAEQIINRAKLFVTAQQTGAGQTV